MTPEYNEGEAQYNSCHSFDLGFVHFVCLNSNQDYSMFDSEGGEVVDDWIKRECAWLDADLTKDEENPTTRWTVCYMHLSPFTCVRTDWVQRFIPTFEKHRVHLVLCGHNHTYSRSIPLYTGYNGYPKADGYDPKGLKTAQEETNLGHGTINHEPDVNNGTYYIMCPSTGYKNTGKETIQNPFPWWYGFKGNHPNQPSYLMLDIGYDKIELKSYKINGILVKDANNNSIVADYGTQTKEMYDSYTINWRPKGQAKM